MKQGQEETTCSGGSRMTHGERKHTTSQYRSLIDSTRSYHIILVWRIKHALSYRVAHF